MLAVAGVVAAPVAVAEAGETTADAVPSAEPETVPEADDVAVPSVDDEAPETRSEAEAELVSFARVAVTTP